MYNESWLNRHTRHTTCSVDHMFHHNGHLSLETVCEIIGGISQT